MDERAPSERDTNPTWWIGGAVLVVLGAVFLLRNMTNFEFDNWWALFILIPAVAAFANAWRLYQRNDRRVTRQVLNTLMGGMAPLIIAVIFLFQLDWSKIWPVFLILAGVGMLVGRSVRD